MSQGTTTGSRVAALCEEIVRRRAEALERRISAYPRTHPIASDLGPCAREMVLAITHWQERPLPSLELKARFERGLLIEDAVIRELGVLGISVRVDRKPFEIRDHQGRLILRGKIDGFIGWEGREYPLEIKSLDPNIFRRVDSAEDFNNTAWMAKYPRQICAYLYANDLEEGFFLLDDCLGHWKLIPVRLDYAEMESILKQCETAIEAVEEIRIDDGDDPEHHLPPYHPDAAVCRRCWAFGRICTPPMEFHGLQLVADAEFETLLDRRGELEAAKREYESIDKVVKERIKEQTGLVIGAWLVEGRWRDRNAYTVKPTRYWESKITKTGANG